MARTERLSPRLFACLALAFCLLCPARSGLAALTPPASLESFDALAVPAALASLGDRATGSPGNAQAAEYVKKTFEALFYDWDEEDYQIGVHRFHTPVRVHEGSSLAVENGPRLPLTPLLANAMDTGAVPEPGVTGPLIYVGRGALTDFDGLPVDNAMVLMDLDSGKNWQNAAMLGAACVIFVEPALPSPAPRAHYKDKEEKNPIAFPRFWISRSQARAAFGAVSDPGLVREAATLTSRCRWQNVASGNVWCFVQGSERDYEEEILLVEAPYDVHGYLPGVAPGASEAVSLASLLDLAANLAKHPPKRSVLLVASGGSGQAMAGLRELLWSATFGRAKVSDYKRMLEQRAIAARKVATALETEDPLALDPSFTQPPPEAESAAAQLDLETARLVSAAVQDRVKNKVDALSTRLNTLRLTRQGGETPEAKAERERQIEALAEERMLYRRLSWIDNYRRPGRELSARERSTLAAVVPETLTNQRHILEDAETQLTDMKTGGQLRKYFSDVRVVAAVSLHLSSGGDGVGGFAQGWMFQHRERINRTRHYVYLEQILRETAEAMGEDLATLFQDTLRPSRRTYWRSYLPDRPALGGEVTALLDLPGFSLATTHDTRPFQGTPHDTPDKLDMGYLSAQQELVTGLLTRLATGEVENPDYEGRNGFAMLKGRANLLRQGELFPDRAAEGVVVQTYIGDQHYYSWVDPAGVFKLVGFADRKHVYDKAIIEAYRLDPETGRAVWAIDKHETGKDAYRTSVRKQYGETDLVFFNCAQTAIYNSFEPRTFHYLYRVELYDGRTEAPPLRYWYSRFDTWESSVSSIFMEPIAQLKLTLSDTVLGRKLLLLNGSEARPEGVGYPMARTPAIPMTEYRAAEDMWQLVGPRVANLETHGIINQRIREMRTEGLAALQDARDALEDKHYAAAMDHARTAWAMASRVYNDIDSTQKDVLFGVLFYIALFVPFAYCMERIFFNLVDINKRIVAFLAILLATIGVIYMVHPAFQLTYSPMVVVLAFFIVGLSVLVSLIIFFRFEAEMSQLQSRSRAVQDAGIGKFKAFAAAFSIGVTNLRRRKVRTFLTTTTLVILTFTIMNFTAVKSVRDYGRVSFAETASYRGLLMRTIHWRELPPETLMVVANDFKNREVPAAVSPRVWYEFDDKTRTLDLPLTRIEISPMGRGNMGLGGKGMDGMTADGQNAGMAKGGMGRHHGLKLHNPRATAHGMVGLGAAEPAVTGLDAALAAGRWFSENEPYGLLLPLPLARELGIGPADFQDNAVPPRVEIWGVPFTVTGVFDPARWTERTDLDGEIISPVTYPTETETFMAEEVAEAIESGEDVQQYQSRYRHVPAEQTVVVPAETLLSLGFGREGGAALVGLAVNPDPGERQTTDLNALGKELSDRYGLMLFSGELAGPEAGTSLYYAANTLQYKGVSNILIPIAIAVCIVLNTMIGAVYERKREIGIYTSVGLAPTHVSFLFIAESLAFAVLAVVVGYLLAQGAAAVLAGTSVWAGMTANYSSLAGVAAMLLVILVALASTIYPSKVAGEIAIPDVNRSWTLPGKEETAGGEMLIILPFLIKYHEQACAGGYLLDYYAGHEDVSHGLFSSEGLTATTGCPIGLTDNQRKVVEEEAISCFSLAFRVWMAPFDFGVRQRVGLDFCPADDYPGFLQVRVRLTREAGEEAVWRRLCKSFLNDLRKQLLVWRSLDQAEKDRYKAYLGEELGSVLDDLVKEETTPPEVTL